MVVNNASSCPNCGGDLKQLGYADRIVRGKSGKIRWVKIRRLICGNCKMIHRELPDYLIPYKHYEADIIKGVLGGFITSDDLDYEDYPCESTVKEWRSAKKNIFFIEGGVI